MPQNGIHAMVGVVARKWLPNRAWLWVGVVVGNMFPDLDALVVAYATLAKLPDPGQYHRTFTHSLFTVLALVLSFYFITVVTKNENWQNFGLGFSAGMVMHIGFDLILWFNGVELLWPIRYELNFWSWFVMPPWLKILLDTAEFLAFGLYFMMLAALARRNNTDQAIRHSPRLWAYVEFALFILFTLVFFGMGARGLQYSLFGVFYLVSLIAGILITIRMRQTLESSSS